MIVGTDNDIPDGSIVNDDDHGIASQGRKCDNGNPAYTPPLPPSSLHSRGAPPPAVDAPEVDAQLHATMYLPQREATRVARRRCRPYIRGRDEQNGAELCARGESWCLACLAWPLGASMHRSASRSLTRPHPLSPPLPLPLSLVFSISVHNARRRRRLKCEERRRRSCRIYLRLLCGFINWDRTIVIDTT